MKKADAVLQEPSTLSDDDSFFVVKRRKSGFYYPLHAHTDFELNFVANAAGAIRIVGDSVEEMGDLDLMLVAGGTRHAYTNHKCRCDGIVEINIQFHASMFDSVINKRNFKSIKDMLENASNGIIFGEDVIVQVKDDLDALTVDEPDSLANFLRLINILKILSMDKGARCLNATEALMNYNKGETDRLESIILYLHENYQSQILLPDLAAAMSMSESSLTRFLKKWTGKTFIDNLNDIRIAEVVNRLIDTRESVSEICYKCGFNNLSNFNRIFKNRKGYTPKEYRERYARTRFKI